MQCWCWCSALLAFKRDWRVVCIKCCFVSICLTEVFLVDSTSSTGSSNSFYTSGKPRLCSSSAVNGSNQLCSYLADRLAADKIDLAAPPFSSKVSANKPHLINIYSIPAVAAPEKGFSWPSKDAETPRSVTFCDPPISSTRQIPRKGAADY